MTSQGYTSKTLSDINKQSNTRSRSRETQSSDDMSPFEVARNIWKQMSKPPKVMMIDVDTSKDRMAELEKKVIMVKKMV
ncbi:ty3-gypsy retrotransposon protein [Cucumis melo var. makuwa]|uniref:Ty3-gypsy retrotransposon protein n=1 Tax=Cucumis melo var. makuwa TaxID=1194695 RepID=A0A5D3E5N5_CUCMM|nr:ty3-gypsy retrotransposon protein [Cucumis melo var. makuwa]TYK30911.1 ty3-gypsy retrotransposon protein [Cucumis melo var. makuwa]